MTSPTPEDFVPWSDADRAADFGDLLGTPAPARTPEQGHDPKCLARAVICAVENLRDIDGMTQHEFRIQMQNNPVYEADRYLAEGILDCICPPRVQPTTPKES